MISATEQRVMIFIVCLIILFVTFLCLFKIRDIEKHLTESEQDMDAQVQVDVDSYNIQRDRIAAYLTRKHGRYPKVVAEACMLTSMPELCAAVAYRESTANPYCLPGDRGASRGGWQIQPKHWGHVPTDPNQQAMKWSRVMAVLYEKRGNIIEALADYNEGHRFGLTGMRYAADVLAMREEMLR